MKHLLRAVQAFSLLLALSLASCAPTSGPPDDPATDASAVLAEVGDAYWQVMLEDGTYLKTMLGIDVEHLPDFASAYRLESAARAREWLGRLEGLDESGLTETEWVSLEVLRWDLARSIELAEIDPRVPFVTPYWFSGYDLHGVFHKTRVEDAEDAERYLRLVGEYPDVLDGFVARLARQIDEGWVLAAPAIDPVVVMWSRFAASPESVFVACAGELPAAVPSDFCARLDEAIETRVKPAWARLVAMIDGPYRAAAPAGVGLGQYPGGDEVYRTWIRYWTTLDMDPEAIHALGLAQLEANGREMAALREELGWEGTQAEVFAKLRRDPDLLASTPEEVGRRLMAYVERIEPHVDQAFGLRPEAPYGVERLDPNFEGSMTFGYYDPPQADRPRGIYYFNGSQLDQRPLLTAGSLIYHELIPGHHFQVAIQSEMEGLPLWRSEGTFHSGFSEGWAEYASGLAGELGMYDDPVDRYGRLAAANFFASRLVVDTGMHHFGWSLEEARELMAAHTIETKTQIASETLRYATDLTGQALAYALGAAKIRQLRERAEERLGERFDLRAFHDLVLSQGSLPLAVLEKRVDRWIEEES